MRIASGEEVLVCRVLKEDGAAGFGFSFRLESTEARHMAEWHAGLRKPRPSCEPVLNHPWERAWIEGKEIDWKSEPAFPSLQWLP